MFSQSDLRFTRYRPNAVMAPHSHNEASLNLVLGGGFAERIEGEERQYRRGVAAFCPAHATHAQRFSHDGAGQIIFSLTEDRLAYLADAGLRLDEAPFADSPAFLALGSKLLQELETNDDFTSLAREGLVLEIVAAFARGSEACRSRKEPPAWLCAARDFLHANASSSPGMKRIARAAGRHEIHLAREFRRFYGMSVGAYMRQLKLEQATRLLRDQRSSISDISYECGFASHAHLCRTFKAHYGITPSEYRTRNC